MVDQVLFTFVGVLTLEVSTLENVLLFKGDFADVVDYVGVFKVAVFFGVFII